MRVWFQTAQDKFRLENPGISSVKYDTRAREPNGISYACPVMVAHANSTLTSLPSPAYVLNNICNELQAINDEHFETVDAYDDWHSQWDDFFVHH